MSGSRWRWLVGLGEWAFMSVFFTALALLTTPSWSLAEAIGVGIASAAIFVVVIHATGLVVGRFAVWLRDRMA
jgi:hypothetical protein